MIEMKGLLQEIDEKRVLQVIKWIVIIVASMIVLFTVVRLIGQKMNSMC